MKGNQAPLLMANGMPRASTVPSMGSHTLNGKPLKPSLKNMTGIFLGLDSSALPQRSRQAGGTVQSAGGRLVPPLARGRGMPVRVRTPTEQRRYKMVENLRSQKEETVKTMEDKRNGLAGNPVKAHQRRTKSTLQQDDLSTIKHFTRHPSQAEIQELTKKNPREYSFVNNQGVNHPEYLKYAETSQSEPPLISDAFSVRLGDTVAHEVDRVSKSQDLIGLEDCYKKICRGNIDSLHSLLPQRKVQQARKDRQLRNTGFAVKSYRNPAQAEIMAQFPGDESALLSSSRPKTTGGRAFVPQPYFFKLYAQPYRTNSSPARIKKSPFEEQFDSLQGNSKVLASPGAGALSRSVSRGRTLMNTPAGRATTPMEVDDLAESLRKDMLIDLNNQEEDINSTVDISLPELINADTQSETQDIKTPSANNNIVNTVSENNNKNAGVDNLINKSSDTSSTDQSDNRNHNTKDTNSENTEKKENITENIAQMVDSLNPDININMKDMDENMSINLVLQNEEGSEDVLDIDEADEVLATTPPGDKKAPTSQRRTSIQERLQKMKSSESLVESIKSDCESRKREFQDLIEEHAHIIEEITVIKGSSSVEADLNNINDE